METVNELSLDELKKLVAAREKKEKAQREKAKKAYESKKNNTVDELIEEAEQLSLALGRFKSKVHVVMEQQSKELAEYGSIRSNSKGGFTLPHGDGRKAITRRRDLDPVWDERADKAVLLIKDFLSDTVKKRDADLHDILMGFLERNAKGDLEYAKVMELLHHEDKFKDERWVEGLQLIKESYSLSFKAFGYDFKQRDEHGKWRRVELNFSAL